MTISEIAIDVLRRLESVGVRYAVGGSLSSSVWGQMRQTNDIDIAVRVEAQNVEPLLKAFQDPYYVSRTELEEALVSRDEYRMVQLLHMEEAFKIDLFLLRDGPYESSELDRARLVELAPGVMGRFAAPENIVLAKLRWFIEGNRVSDRQWHDIVQVLEVQRGALDDEYLDRWAAFLGVDELLESAREQARP